MLRYPTSLPLHLHASVGLFPEWWHVSPRSRWSIRRLWQWQTAEQSSILQSRLAVKGGHNGRRLEHWSTGCGRKLLLNTDWGWNDSFNFWDSVWRGSGWYAVLQCNVRWYEVKSDAGSHCRKWHKAWLSIQLNLYELHYYPNNRGSCLHCVYLQ